jgi:hypothetical protein
MPGIQYPFAHVPMLGKGSILFDRFDAFGNPTGYVPFGNATKFEYGMKDDRAELFQSLNKNSSLIANALKKRTITCAITGTDFRSDMQAIAMMSSGKTVLTTAVATITAELLASATATLPGRYFALANRNVDNVTTPPALTCNAVVLVAGTDYVVVDPVEGLIYFPTNTGAAAGHAVTATYHTLVGSQDQVAPATQPQIVGKLRFVPDPTDGQKIGVEIWRVNLYPAGQMGLIADDYGNWTLDGAILDDTSNHPNSPYGIETFYS